MRMNALAISVATAAKSPPASLLAAVAGLAFAAWADNGADIFVAMVESGLSWCF